MEPLAWLGDRLVIIDQTKLPHEVVRVPINDYREVISAIKTLRVRGAPVIGLAAAYGLAIAARSIHARDRGSFLAKFDLIAAEFAASRPTAVDLFHAVDRMKNAARHVTYATMSEALLKEAQALHAGQRRATRAMSEYGSALIGDGFTILTHCNAGPLATGGAGTALGTIIRAHHQGKKVLVYACETRPLLQGARLTVWELQRAGVPVVLITDSMAGHVLRCKDVDCVITGADRVAANGDAANKVGTYSIAVLASANGVPFYLAAPLSTFDVTIGSGVEIPIEERAPEEVACLGGMRVASPGVKVYNPAFDVTPARYIKAIITERGILRRPYRAAIRALFKESERG
jgi:methylthioribose-1-phosphate isomerase